MKKRKVVCKSPKESSIQTIAPKQNTNGAGEIEANNRRLASTKRSVSLAAKHLEAIEREQTAKEKAFKIAQDALKIAQNGFKMAEKELNAARKNTDDAKKEQQEAEADLKHAEECAEAAQKKLGGN